jgi:hypothetical protein
MNANRSAGKGIVSAVRSSHWPAAWPKQLLFRQRACACVRACVQVHAAISRRAHVLSLVASLGQRCYKSTVHRFPALRVGDWHGDGGLCPKRHKLPTSLALRDGGDTS